ncbi:MAG: hypothetical protein NXY57DRAFT_1060372, partial [Lentinula lateritia]
MLDYSPLIEQLVIMADDPFTPIHNQNTPGTFQSIKEVEDIQIGESAVYNFLYYPEPHSEPVFPGTKNSFPFELLMSYRVWKVVYEKDQWLVYCKLCHTAGQSPYHARSHQKRPKHIENLEAAEFQDHTDHNIFDLAVSRLLQELGDPATPKEHLPPLSDFIDEHEQPSSEFEPLAQFNWGDFEGVNTELHGSYEDDSIQALSNYMLDIFQYGPDAVDSDEDASDGEHSDISDEDRHSFLGDDAFNLRVNGVEDATSIKSMKDLDMKLQSLYGIQTFKYKGAFGHLYYINSLADIISQEMCNPLVREHLSFYPEDCSSQNVSKARQFAQWLHEVPDEDLGPMARLGPPGRSHDYYFKRQGKLYAKCWKLKANVRQDGSKGWNVIKGDGEFVVNEDEFLLCFTQLVEGQRDLYKDVVNVTHIDGILDMTTTPPTLMEWKLTDPLVGNKWRQKANGAECLSFPIWLYCDDTSGNTSKRWNAHNSFLFTAAGLPRSEISKEYNVHFLATSNSAPTLEMLDGIADQLQDCQENGIWAWDPKTQSRVLLLSEFACHIGLRGKLFCRTCWVKGKDAKAGNISLPDEAPADNSDNEFETGSAASGSTTASKGGKKKKQKVFKESLKTMYDCVKAFVKPAKPRNRDETIIAIKTQFVHAETVGTAKKIKEMRTESGVKDTYQLFFVNRLLKRRQNSNAEPLQASQSTTDNPMSPVWRIRGLDPHSDTPVEILHVVLLGFVKYLWRDVIDNQLKKNVEKKKELATHLSSVDVAGLGLDSQLTGDVLVNHYRSLTGSDFRKICQVAPCVLKEFVTDECYQTWLSLSKLIPLIWQPEIESLDSYITLLEHEIEQFLLHAAKWSIRWFNKPKFHILVHLPDHIRRFGPAMLFATEVFESYNAVIRAKSIHSNRLAPSRDIAWAFARQNQIRHMLSRGVFLDHTHISPDLDADKKFEDTTLLQKERITQVQQYFRNGSFAQNHWVQVGKSASDVVSWSDNIKKYLGLTDAVAGSLPGTFVQDPSSLLQKWGNTQTERGISVVRLHEALGCKRDAFPIQNIDCVLVQGMKVSKEASSHGMPRLSASGEYFAVPPSIDGKIRVRQEQQKTMEVKDTVIHTGVLEDWVLNTAQMRDTKYLQRFRIPAKPLVLEYVLEQSATQEWALQNPRKPAQTETPSLPQ